MTFLLFVLSAAVLEGIVRYAEAKGARAKKKRASLLPIVLPLPNPASQPVTSEATTEGVLSLFHSIEQHRYSEERSKAPENTSSVKT